MEKLNTLRAQLVDVKKNCVLLCPKSVNEQLSATKSKLGGTGILDGTAPVCPICKSTTSFVLQIFKKEFPSLFYSEGHDLFTVYRCESDDCEGIYDDTTDQFTVFRFHRLSEYSQIAVCSDDELIYSFPSCQFDPVKVDDYPNYEEGLYPAVEPVAGIGDDELDEMLTDHFSPRHGTKIGGYPAFTQSPWYPSCPTCKKSTDFIFQLASGESIDAHTENKYPNWSDHGITIGDLGNIYAYVCKQCDPTKVLTYWDCY